jgi:hypothetical protein
MTVSRNARFTAAGLAVGLVAAAVVAWQTLPAPVLPRPGEAALLEGVAPPPPPPLPRILSDADLLAVAGTSRPLLLFSPTSEDGRLTDQKDLLPPAETLAGRDVRVVEVFENEFGRSGDDYIHPSAGRALRRKHSVPDGEFALVLVDRDGRECLRSEQPVAWSRLVEALDARAARQPEATRRGA